MSGKSMSVPLIEVDQFWLPAITWERLLTPAATYCTPGTSRIACASSGVSVLALPWPMRTPPCWKLPALTMIMFVPADWICVSIDDCAPVPSATIVITAETPMIMPSMVSAVRILLRASALNAIRNTMRNDIVTLPPLPLGVARVLQSRFGVSSPSCR
jgi:hypothetical protein